jgi:hypothetical protein
MIKFLKAKAIAADIIPNSILGAGAATFAWLPPVEKINAVLALCLTVLGIIGAIPVAIYKWRQLLNETDNEGEQ